MQILQQDPQRALLSFSACVLWSLAVGSEAADVAYADAVAVVVLTVSALHFLWSPWFNSSVNGNDVVVSAAEPTEGTVIAVDV